MVFEHFHKILLIPIVDRFHRHIAMRFLLFFLQPLSRFFQDSDSADTDRAELWIFLGHEVVSVLHSACTKLPWNNRVAGRWEAEELRS